MWVDVKTEDCQKLVCDGRIAITSPQADCSVVVDDFESKYGGNCQTYCGAQQDGILDCVAHYDEYEDTCQPQGYDLGCDYVSESSDNICVCGLRAPTPSPTFSPSDAPTATPSDAPSATPSDAPSAKPSDAPTATLVIFGESYPSTTTELRAPPASPTPGDARRAARPPLDVAGPSAGTTSPARSRPRSACSRR